MNSEHVVAAIADGGVLQVLVKLAAIGTAGVGIFGVFWAGFLLLKLSNDAPAKKHESIRFYMGMSVIMSIIVACTTLIATFIDNHYRNALDKVTAEKTQLSNDNKGLVKSTTSQAAQLKDMDSRLRLYDQAVGSIATSLSAKFDDDLRFVPAGNPREIILGHIERMRAAIRKVNPDLV